MDALQESAFRHPADICFVIPANIRLVELSDTRRGRLCRAGTRRAHAAEPEERS
jgi:hypothetical protein